MAGGTSAEHGYSIVGKKWGPEKGNTGRRGREEHEEHTEGEVPQHDGANVNFYENMIHHGEGGMIAPGEAPLTVGPGPGSSFRGPVERLKPSGMRKGGPVRSRR